MKLQDVWDVGRKETTGNNQRVINKLMKSLVIVSLSQHENLFNKLLDFFIRSFVFSVTSGTPERSWLRIWPRWQTVGLKERAWSRNMIFGEQLMRGEVLKRMSWVLAALKRTQWDWANRIQVSSIILSALGEEPKEQHHQRNKLHQQNGVFYDSQLLVSRDHNLHALMCVPVRY